MNIKQEAYNELQTAYYQLRDEKDNLQSINASLVEACQMALNHLEGLGDYYRNANPKTISILQQALSRAKEVQ